ncbi:hypothetical protein [Methanocella sp. MCL-LM]|uniref:hypothetical protein n=1 Tax=Methanocella sp. MCL-LM TaxID=3412035 RepID=UPI003C718324
MFKSLKGWLSGKDDPMDAVVREAIADDRVCVALRLVLENPGISRETLGERAGFGPAVAGQCVERLIADRLIEKAGGAGYSVAESARPAVIKYLPLNYQCPGLLR